MGPGPSWQLLKDGRQREGWFIAAQAGLMPPIAKRNDAMWVLHRTWTPAATEVVRSARKKLKREVDAEKAMWVRGTIGTTQFPGDGRPVTPKTLWNAIFLLN